MSTQISVPFDVDKRQTKSVCQWAEETPLLQQPVANPDLQDAMRKDANRFWGVPSHTRHNPCPKPVSLKRENIPHLLSVPYMAADKTDGVRFQLMLSRLPDHLGSQEYAVLVNERNQFFEVKTTCWADYYDGTLIDGELLIQNCNGVEVKRYLAFDIVVLQGSRVADRDYAHRCQLLKEILYTSPWPVAEIERKTLASKGLILMCETTMALLPKPTIRPLTFKGLQELIAMYHMPNKPYGMDGMMFTPVLDGVRFGRHYGMFKLKVGENHTVDLRIVTETFVYPPNFPGAEDCVQPSVRRGIFIMSDEGTGQEIEAVGHYLQRGPFPMLPDPTAQWPAPGTSSIWECRVKWGDYCWYVYPLRERVDKPAPNSFETVQNTLINIVENISFEEILQVLATTTQ